MTDKTIRGVPILDVTASGCTPDGRYIWLHFKLPEGNEHNFFIDLAHVDKTMRMMRQAAGQAIDLQATSSAPGGNAAEMLNDPTPVTSISVLTSPLHEGIIFQSTSGDGPPVSLQLPLELARQLAAQLPDVVEAIATKAAGGDGTRRLN
jgi:hypothetical protein